MSSILSTVAWTISLSFVLTTVSLAGPGSGKMASVHVTTMSTFRPTVAGQGDILTYLTRWFESQGVKGLCANQLKD